MVFGVTRAALTAILLTLASIAAFAVTLPPLPAPAFVDTEVATNCPIAHCNRETSHFEFTLAFSATPSNNVEVAFGTDANGDGVLDACEADLSIGWDCGEWFLANPVGNLRQTESAEAGEKSLAFTMLLHVPAAPQSLAIADGTNALFSVTTATPPDWSFAPDWNLMSLTARGVDDPGEHFEVRFAPDGLIIFFR